VQVSKPAETLGLFIVPRWWRVLFYVTPGSADLFEISQNQKFDFRAIVYFMPVQITVWA